MSYNISTWHTKEIDNLYIPLKSLCPPPTCRECDWELDVMLEITEEITMVRVELGDGHILGQLDFEKRAVFVTEIKWISGEGSGTDYHGIIIPILESSIGKLVAILVWEGGDSITKLEVQDGVVSESQIEL